MTDTDRQILVNKYFTPEQVVCMDYIAVKASREVFAEHLQACPKEPKIAELTTRVDVIEKRHQTVGKTGKEIFTTIKDVAVLIVAGFVLYKLGVH